MNKDYQHITFVMDRSGSMQAMALQAVSGFNELVSRAAAVPGKASFKLVLFNHMVDAEETRPLGRVAVLRAQDYAPTGMTALYDALSYAIDKTGEELAAMPEEERPGRVLVAVMTDGLENSSTNTTLAMLRRKIERQQSEYAWEFLFLASGINAESEVAALGISPKAYSGGSGQSLQTAYYIGTRTVADWRAGQSIENALGTDAGEHPPQ